MFPPSLGWAAKSEGIYTLPLYRKQGIGRSGAAWTPAGYWNGLNEPSCWSIADNETATQIYADLGYLKVLESRTIFVA